MRSCWPPQSMAAVALAAAILPLALFTSGRVLGDPLSAAETVAYEQWLHSVEQVAGVVAESGAEPQLSLFPFGDPVRPEGQAQPYRYLAIGRALQQMEGPARREDVENSGNTLAAMNLARSYRYLGEYEKSLRWFDQAAQWDSAEVHTADIWQGTLAAAVALDDSLQAMRILLNIMGAADITAHETEYILAYRYLLGKADTATLPLLMQKVKRQQKDIGPALRYWHAFALAAQQDADSALGQLRWLIRSGGLSQDLSLEQRAWVLTAIPDLLLVQGRGQEAEPLYTQLAASTVTELNSWGNLQLANLDLARGRYGRAWRVYDRLCHSTETGHWQSAACEMATHAERLYGLKTEGETHGLAAMHER